MSPSWLISTRSGPCFCAARTAPRTSPLTPAPIIRVAACGAFDRGSLRTLSTAAPRALARSPASIGSAPPAASPSSVRRNAAHSRATRAAVTASASNAACSFLFCAMTTAAPPSPPRRAPPLRRPSAALLAQSFRLGDHLGPSLLRRHRSSLPSPRPRGRGGQTLRRPLPVLLQQFLGRNRCFSFFFDFERLGDAQGAAFMACAVRGPIGVGALHGWVVEVGAISSACLCSRPGPQAARLLGRRLSFPLLPCRVEWILRAPLEPSVVPSRGTWARRPARPSSAAERADGVGTGRGAQVVAAAFGVGAGARAGACRILRRPTARACLSIARRRRAPCENRHAAPLSQLPMRQYLHGFDLGFGGFFSRTRRRRGVSFFLRLVSGGRRAGAWRPRGPRGGAASACSPSRASACRRRLGRWAPCLPGRLEPPARLLWAAPASAHRPRASCPAYLVQPALTTFTGALASGVTSRFMAGPLMLLPDPA